jgi:hypothetical protein
MEIISAQKSVYKMLIFGHHYIKSEKLYHVNSIEAIQNTPSNSTLLFSYDEEVIELINYANENSLKFAVDVRSLKEAIICENLDCFYILVKDEIAIEVQKAADTYVFDSKILVHAKDENSIEKFASEGIDGIIFQEAIIKIS